MALSKTAHWLFDRGFWSLSDDWRVLVKTQVFHEQGDAGLLLKPKDGELLAQLPEMSRRPDPERLAWHRKRHGY